MSDISAARQKTMSSAVGRVNDAKQRAMSMLKSDRFLADANWDIVSKTACIDDPYKHLDISEVNNYKHSIIFAMTAVQSGKVSKLDQFRVFSINIM